MVEKQEVSKKNDSSPPVVESIHPTIVSANRLGNSSYSIGQKEKKIEIPGLNPLSQPKMAERIVSALVDYISSAKLPPGHKLPSEKLMLEITVINKKQYNLQFDLGQ